MDKRRIGINLGYVLGFSSLVAALIYFYASNWPLLSRGERFVPLYLFVVGLFGLSVYLSRKKGRQLLSRLSLLGSVIAFGVGIAVVGQTYNSHADSYGLFALWAVPALIFSVLTRWQPFYVLTYLLINLAYYFYFNPNSGWVSFSETEQLLIVGIWAVIQGLLYGWTTWKKGISPVIRFLSFVLLVVLLLGLSNSHIYPTYGLVMNAPLAAYLAGGIWYSRKSGDKMYFLWNGLGVSAAVITKYTELAAYYFNELFILTSLLFVAAFIAANIWFLKFVQRLFPQDAEAPAAAPSGETVPGAAKSTGGGGLGVWAAKVLTVSAILIGTVIGLISFLGLNYMIFQWENPEYVLMAVGLLFMIGMLLKRKWSPIIRYVFIGIGLAVGAGAALFAGHDAVLWVYTGVTIYAFVVERGLAQRSFFFTCSVLMVTILLDQIVDEVEGSIGIMGLVLLVFSLLSGRTAGWNQQIRAILERGGYAGFLAALFLLTFMGESQLYYVYNGLFFAVSLGGMVLASRKGANWRLFISFGFWMAFLLWKYYDLAWQLRHKSISLALLGILVMTAVYLIEKRWSLPPREERAAQAAAYPRIWMASLVIVIQVLLLTLQIGKSEWVLAHGQTIKLELMPRDPRSLLQGDYVQLRYGISEPEGLEKYTDDLHYNEKVKIVLRQDSKGVYRFAGVAGMETEPMRPGDVVINGNWNGYDGFFYGIENYFVPEGTGLEVERNARYAEVKVGSGGDALLVRLMKEE